jgi:hypothetical protein
MDRWLPGLTYVALLYYFTMTDNPPPMWIGVLVFLAAMCAFKYLKSGAAQKKTEGWHMPYLDKRSGRYFWGQVDLRAKGGGCPKMSFDRWDDAQAFEDRIRHAWMDAALNKIDALKPSAVVAGHKIPGNDDSPKNVEETRQYIRGFIRLNDATKTARELYDQMLELYPDRANPGSLWSSAAAAKAET